MLKGAQSRPCQEIENGAGSNIRSKPLNSFNQNIISFLPETWGFLKNALFIFHKILYLANTESNNDSLPVRRLSLHHPS